MVTSPHVTGSLKQKQVMIQLGVRLISKITCQLPTGSVVLAPVEFLEGPHPRRLMPSW